MKLPPKSPDMETAIENLHRRYARYERILMDEIDELARAGFSDKRLCAVARTDFEKAFLVLHKALRDYPGDDASDYGKILGSSPVPKEFTPRADPSPGRLPDGGPDREPPYE
jgi:hypothetical protein